MNTDPFGKDAGRGLPARVLRWLVGAQGRPGPYWQRGSRYYATRSMVILACIVPLVSLGTCQAANRPAASGTVVSVALALFGLSMLLGLVALVLRLARAPGSSALAVLFNVLGVGANVYYLITHFTYTRGRQVRSGLGRVLPSRAGEVLERGASLEARAAQTWRNNADTEAASVAAFSLLSLDLATLGAPLELVRAAHRDALDEIEHAERCYALASHFGDRQAGVAPLLGLDQVRSRACSYASVAVESWVEGAYLEAVSAEIAQALLENLTDDVVRPVLKTIAHDEAKHARHAWAVIEWCLERDPERVRGALWSVAARMQAPDPRGNEPGSDGALEPLGIPGRELQRKIATRCLAHAREQLGGLLLRRPNPRAPAGPGPP